MARWFLLFIMLFVALSPAFAGPGGVFRSPIVWWVAAILLPILLPLYIYVTLKERRKIQATEKDLARLAAVYPQYQWLTLRDRAQDTFRWMWSEWSRGKIEKSREFVTDWYWRNQELLLEEWESKNLENVCELHNLLSLKPFFVAHNVENPHGEGSRVVVKINAEVWDFLREKSSGKIVKGEDKVGNLATLWTFVWDGQNWLLDRIEEGGLSLEYTKIANIVPDMLNQMPTTYNNSK